jgi:AcrR family transcriptional regulator
MPELEMSLGAARLTRQARAQQIADGAALMVVEQGCLPLPPEALSQRMGVSKALVYAYFPSQQSLANHILRDHLAAIAAPVNQLLDEAPADLAERCIEAYFEHVATHGPVLHILLGDPFLAGNLEPGVQALYGRVMRRLANALRARLGISRADAIPALHILATLPEEAGALVFAGKLDHDLGRALALEMTLGGLEGLAAETRTTDQV